MRRSAEEKILKIVAKTREKIDAFFFRPTHPATKKLDNDRSAHDCDAINFYNTPEFTGLFQRSCMNSQIPEILASIVYNFLTNEQLQEPKKQEPERVCVGIRWIKNSRYPGGEREERIYEECARPEAKTQDAVNQMRVAYANLVQDGKDMKPETILSDCYFVLKTINEILRQGTFYFASDRLGVEKERKTRSELMALTLHLRDTVTELLSDMDSKTIDGTSKECLENIIKVIKENLGKSWKIINIIHANCLFPIAFGSNRETNSICCCFCCSCSCSCNLGSSKTQTLTL